MYGVLGEVYKGSCEGDSNSEDGDSEHLRQAIEAFYVE